eukprot:11548-Heterococcus_DN1.PRE.1
MHSRLFAVERGGAAVVATQSEHKNTAIIRSTRGAVAITTMPKCLCSARVVACSMCSTTSIYMISSQTTPCSDTSSSGSGSGSGSGSTYNVSAVVDQSH